MVIENLEQWLRAFLRIGIPGILLALALAWAAARLSAFLQGDATREAAAALQRRLLFGRAPLRRLTVPWFNRALVFFFLILAATMLLMWIGKLLQLLLF